MFDKRYWLLYLWIICPCFLCCGGRGWGGRWLVVFPDFAKRRNAKGQTLNPRNISPYLLVLPAGRTRKSWGEFCGFCWSLFLNPSFLARIQTAMDGHGCFCPQDARIPGKKAFTCHSFLLRRGASEAISSNWTTMYWSRRHRGETCKI